MEITPELIEQIARQVIQGMNTEVAGESLPQALFLGDIKAAGELVRQYRLDSEAEYAACPDIVPYQLVIIGELTNAQLADIATGRDNAPFTHAVVSALLAGKPVYLLPGALRFRACKQTAPPAFYKLLERYVRRLEEFGVQIKPVCQIAGAAQPPQKSAEADAEKVQKPGVLTAAKAAELLKSGSGELYLAQGTVITPLARDVLRGRKIRMV